MNISKKIIFPILVFILVVFIAITIFSLDKYQKEKILKKSYIKNTYSNYKAVYLVYNKLINYFYIDDIVNSRLEYYLYKKNFNKVYNYLKIKFKMLKQHNISNIFIVDLKGKTIVAVPEKYKKYKVDQIVENQFVFPLKFKHKYLGNIYISVSFSSFQDDLNLIYHDTYLFMLKKEVGLEKIISGNIGSLISSEFSKDFYYEKITIKDIPISFINSQIKDYVIKKLSEKKPFAIPFIYKNKTLIITFLPVFTNNKRFVGYLIRYAIDYNYSLILRSFYINTFIAVTIGFILSLLVFIVLKEGEQLKLLAETDPLTGLYNKGKFNEVLQKEIERAKRYKRPLSLIIFDIDHFKKINDTYGHKIGDDVLKELSKIIKSTLRKTDFAARWGGEEFVILLPETDLEGAKIVAKKLREKVEKHKFPKVGKVTISLGVAQLKPNELPEDFIVRADSALYKAKNSGRNRVEVSI